MGSVINKSANGVGTVFGDALAAPFKAIFGGSCQGVCSGIWDIACFIEHFCISNLIKLVMVIGLCYIILMFFCLLFKVGICQCIARSFCNMWWALFKTYWYVIKDITCFLWYKLKNVKRVNRRRHHHFRDIELGYSFSEENMFTRFDQKSNIRKKRKLFSAYPSQRTTIRIGHANISKHHHRQRSKKQVAFHSKSRAHSRYALSSKRRRVI